MSKVLYTKYRPNNFEDVIGQDIAVQILKRSIETDKINHAYLFYGVRGTGKTTLARIFAKTINCEHPTQGNPCNECDSCKVFNSGQSLDMIEIDAASHNGVDEIRELTEKANYTTTSSKYKVYIIDEVHMLSKSAFNALLKTLEEPPKNTIFLFATTEINKIPDTILSRTIVLNLQLVSAELIKKQLIKILTNENIKYEEEALDYIASLADGSVRDAISLLETSLLYSEEVTKANVIKVLGVLDKELIRKIIKEQDINDINSIDETINGARLMSLLIDELIKLIKSGEKQYKELLNKLTDGLLAIKDPILLNKFIRTVLISYSNNGTILTENNEIKENVSRETITEEVKEEENTENEEVETKEEASEPKEEENTAINEEIEENVSRETIFDHVSTQEIVAEMLQSDSLMLKNIKNKWDFLENYTDSLDSEIISALKEGKPLIATPNLLFIGFKDEWIKDKVKEMTLDCGMHSALKQLSNREIAIIPVTEENWNALIKVAKQAQEKGENYTSSIDINKIFACLQETTRDIALDLFGDKLVNND